MGQGGLSKKKVKVEDLSEIERFLYESYRKIDVDFTSNEVTTLKLKLTDDKFYFRREFSFLLFFNNSIFSDNINQIYKNFNSKIESFINNSPEKKFFNVLLIIDDEIETLKSGSKIDFDGLFTIAFERMEILIMLFIDVTNCHPEYVNEFIKQLCENSILYKSGRKFDCIYILLPNTDYIIKNSQTVSFLTTRNDYILSEEENCLFDLFNIDSFLNFLKCKYPFTSSNNQYMKFVQKVKPISCSTALYINFDLEISEFPNENLYQFITIETLTSCSPENVFYIYINPNFSYNENFDLFVNKVISSFDNATEKYKDKGAYLKIKIILVSSMIVEKNILNNGYKKIDGSDISETDNNEEFKLKKVENRMHELLFKKFNKKTDNVPYGSELILEFYEIPDDDNKKNIKENKFRKSTIKYEFIKPIKKRQEEFNNLIIALHKVNLINKLFDKENIVSKQIKKFLGIIKTEDENKDEENKEQENDEAELIKSENGLAYQMKSEEGKEYVKTFETNFLKSI